MFVLENSGRLNEFKKVKSQDELDKRFGALIKEGFGLSDAKKSFFTQHNGIFVNCSPPEDISALYKARRFSDFSRLRSTLFEKIESRIANDPDGILLECVSSLVFKKEAISFFSHEEQKRIAHMKEFNDFDFKKDPILWEKVKLIEFDYCKSLALNDSRVANDPNYKKRVQNAKSLDDIDGIYNEAGFDSFVPKGTHFILRTLMSLLKDEDVIDPNGEKLGLEKREAILIYQTQGALTKAEREKINSFTSVTQLRDYRRKKEENPAWRFEGIKKVTQEYLSDLIDKGVLKNTPELKEAIQEFEKITTVADF